MSEYDVIEELKRMVDHFGTWANDHSMEATTETWSALYCAKQAIQNTQATNCAGCGKYKNTPLRRDEMGGYVCLTCVDKRLDIISEALRKIADDYDGPFGTSNYVPLADMGKELRRRQNIAKDALK